MKNNIWCLLIALGLLNACSTMAPYPNRLVNSMNIGVLKNDARAQKLAEQYLSLHSEDLRRSANSLRYLHATELEQGLLDGNLDIAIGLPSTVVVKSQRIWRTKDINHRKFHFLTRATDPKKLHQYHMINSIMKHSQSIGYISEGSEGEVNLRILKSYSNDYDFVPCGDRLTCLNELREKRIDTLFGEKHSPKVTSRYPSQTLVRSRAREDMAFSLLVNQRTVTYDEFREINKQVSQLFKLRKYQVENYSTTGTN